MDGLKKPELQALTTVKDRITFLYVERCKISRDSGAITCGVSKLIKWEKSGIL